MLEVQLSKLICFCKYAGFQGTVLLHFYCDSQKTKVSIYLLQNVLTSVRLMNRRAKQCDPVQNTYEQ